MCFGSHQQPTIAPAGPRSRRASNLPSAIWLHNELVGMARRAGRTSQRDVPTLLRIAGASALDREERGRRSTRHYLRTAIPTRDRRDESPRSTQIHSLEYESESAIATKRARPRELARVC